MMLIFFIMTLIVWSGRAASTARTRVRALPSVNGPSALRLRPPRGRPSVGGSPPTARPLPILRRQPPCRRPVRRRPSVDGASLRHPPSIAGPPSPCRLGQCAARAPRSGPGRVVRPPSPALRRPLDRAGVPRARPDLVPAAGAARAVLDRAGIRRARPRLVRPPSRPSPRPRSTPC